MRNQTSDQLADYINSNPLPVVFKKFKPFDISEHQFFFIIHNAVVHAYRSGTSWYCKL